MSKQGPWTRREFLQGTSAGIALLPPALLAGSNEQRGQSKSSGYTPHFFTAAEWNFINAAVDRLIPADESGPGGVESGVPEFLDRQLDSPYGYGAFAYMQGPFLTNLPPQLGYQLSYAPRELYRLGIAAADSQCRQIHSDLFFELEIPKQDEYLSQLELGTVQLSGPPAQVFFGQLLSDAKQGYFADPIYGGNRHMGAWKMIGFPGARADFTDWINQAGKPYPYGPVSVAGRSEG
jgi:gluconate 2-dehydrogenase gamma chain